MNEHADELIEQTARLVADCQRMLLALKRHDERLRESECLAAHRHGNLNNRPESFAHGLPGVVVAVAPAAADMPSPKA